MPQDVIANFDLDTLWAERQRADDRALDLLSMVEAIAEMTYIARAKYLGDQLLPWGVLTAGQRQGYVTEIETLVKGAAQ